MRRLVFLVLLMFAISFDVTLGSEPSTPTLFIHTCPHGNEREDSSRSPTTGVEKSTLSDDVTISLSHEAMIGWLDLVDDLEYTVTVTSKQDTAAMMSEIICLGTTSHEPSHVSNLISSVVDGNVASDYNVTYAACDRTNDGRIRLPLELKWSPHAQLEESQCVSCLAILGLGSQEMSFHRSDPVTMCRPTDVCRQYLTEESGSITSPGFPVRYPDNVDCNFTIIGKPGTSIDIQFQDVRLEPSYSGRCMDYIRVSYQNTEEPPFCGSMTSLQLSQYRYDSGSSIARIRFFTDSKIGSNGFRALYTARGQSACNVNYTSTEGTVSSPGYPKPYLPNRNCSSYIRLPPSYRIIIKLILLDLGNETESPCSNDVIKIADVTSSKSVVTLPCSKVATFPSDRVIFESSSSTVEIKFTSDHVVEGRGFRLTYKGVPSCRNASFTGDSGVLASPNYPNNYPNNQKCFFMVEVGEFENLTSGIELQFKSLVTESDDKRTPLRNTLCQRDFLEIKAGNASYKLCGDWSGKEHVITFPFLAHNVTFVFVSDDQTTATGFYATWRRVLMDEDLETRVCPSKAVSLNASHFEIVHKALSWWDGETDCRSKGGHLAKVDDAIMHGFIGDLIAESSCSPFDSYWIGANDLDWESDFFWSGGGKVTRPNWFSGWTDPDGYNRQPSDDGFTHEDCVEVRRRFYLPWKGTKDVGEYFWNDRLCDAKNPYICRLDEGAPDAKAIAVPCDVTIRLEDLPLNDVTVSLSESEFQTFGSPNYPASYDNFLKCVYTITSPSNTGMLLEFEDFHLEGANESGRCVYDYLELEAGDGSNSSTSRPPRVKDEVEGQRLCGDWSGKTKLIHQVFWHNSLSLNFVTDHSRRFSGFKAKVKSLNVSRLCGDPNASLFEGKCLVVSDAESSVQEAAERCRPSAPLSNEQWWDDLMNAMTDGQMNPMLDVLVELVWPEGGNARDDDAPVIFWKPQIDADTMGTCVSVRKSTKDTSGQKLLTEELSTCPEKARFLCVKDPSPYDVTPTSQSAYLSSPGNASLADLFDWQHYPDLATVRIHMTSSADHVILLNFSSIDVEEQTDCLYDYILVSNSSLADRRICSQGNESENVFVVTQTNESVIEFHSDYSVTGTGFDFSWLSIDTSFCHQEIILSSERVPFNSFNFPLPYPAQVHCSLTFTSQRSIDKTIMLVLDAIFPIQMADSITYSTQQGDESDESSESKLGRSFYQENEPFVLVSNTGFIRLRYSIPEGFKPGEGFTGYAIAASSQLKAPESLVELDEDQIVDLYTHQYPQLLPPNLLQQITIRAPIGYNVKVTLGSFSTTSFAEVNDGREDNNGCHEHIRFDDVSIRSSASGGDESETLGGWCSLSQGQEMTSRLNRLKVLLYSDTDVKTAFRGKLQVSVVEDPDYLTKTRDLVGKVFDSCRESPCLFGSTCISLDDVSARCECEPRYGGLFCQELWCDLDPCLHGWCNMTRQGYTCTCLLGYFGPNCDLDFLHCSMKMCQGHGQCQAGNTSHPTCQCKEGWQGATCGQMVEEGGLSTTLGQRLLKEPIWIGLIVILSVLLLFGILYVVRRKCGKHFHCCEIKKPQVDDNILNADGTITLNSFPLRKMQRTSMLSPVSTPSPTYGLTPKIEEEGSSAAMTPSAKNEGAAARFFASYKDAEKTPIAAPLTTDFSRTTDTSLSQEVDDASVGAMVGGRLQLDLHIRENKAQDEQMSRSASLLEPSPTSRSGSREKIKRSHSTGPYLVRQMTQFDELAVSVQKTASAEGLIGGGGGGGGRGGGVLSQNNVKKKRMNINDFQHIYPHVIVQEAPSSTGGDYNDYAHAHSAQDVIVICQSQSQGRIPNGLVPGLSQGNSDHTGARVLAVNLDEDSEGTGTDSMVKSDQCLSPTQIIPGLRSDPSVVRAVDESKVGRIYPSFEEQFLKEQEKLRRYVASIREWKDRARLRYKLAKMSSLNSSDEYPRYSFKHHDHRYSSKYSGKPTSRRTHRNRSSVHPLRRTYTADTDHVYFSDVSRRREAFTGSNGRMTASMENIECERHRYYSSRRRQDYSQSSCECPECDLVREQRYYISGRHRSRENSERGSTGSRSHRSQKEKQKHEAALTTGESYDPSSIKQRGERGGSQVYRKKSERHNSHGKQSSSFGLRANHDCSSTESDVTRHGGSRSRDSSVRKAGIHRSSTAPNNSLSKTPSPRSTASLGNHARHPLSRSNTPEIIISEIPAAVAEEKDLFCKVFSQEIELDDFSPVEEDDDDFVFSSNSNTKEKLLGETPLPEGIAGIYDKSTIPGESPGRDLHSKLPQFILRVPPPHPLSEPNSPRHKTKTSRIAFPNVQDDSTRLTSSRKTPRNASSCNVIVYDTAISGELLRKPHTIKSERFLSRKHSSLELIHNDRLALPGSSASLRSSASMHDLSADNADTSHDGRGNYLYQNWCGPALESSSSIGVVNSNSSKSLPFSSSSTLNIPRSVQSSSSGICLASYEDDTKDASHRKSPHDGGQQGHPRVEGVANHNANHCPASFLSVTDTDSAMSSVPSPHSTPTDCKMLMNSDPGNSETRVTDSAYQTKQGSMEAEAYLEARARRPATLGGREDDRKVTQRLHQAAVKLLIMQQRLRRTRQNFSRDSAVHTISEDDATLDELTVTSPTSRTFKPGVLYPTQLMSEESFHELPPVHCDRIVEEQDTLTEYEV